MSGSSGGGGAFINSPDEDDNCTGLIINTNLASPQANVIEKLAVGDSLSIVAASDQGPIQALDQDGNVAGNIISREQMRLLNCINNGTIYVGQVTSINNGQCQIIIKAI